MSLPVSGSSAPPSTCCSSLTIPGKRGRTRLAPPQAENAKVSPAKNRPVLAGADFAYIITEMDDGDPPALGYGPRGYSTRYEPDKKRIPFYPWGGVYVITGKRDPAGQAGVDLASLRHITALFEEEVTGPARTPGRYSGREAWSQWLRMLRSARENGPDSPFGHAWDNNLLVHLRYNRSSTVYYLEAMADRHSGAVKRHLDTAAGIYRTILQRLRSQPMPYPGPAEGGIDAYIATVETVAQCEALAVRELRRAADLLNESR